MRLHPANRDWPDFAFSADNRAAAEACLARYPQDRRQSAVLPLLDLAQRQCGGWVPHAAIAHIARYLGMPEIRVMEVASFYSMINQAPVGRYFVQLCRTTPCWLRGADGLRDAAIRETGCAPGETGADGLFSLVEVECLGACCNAPVVQINDDYYEDLTAESLTDLLRALRRGETPPPGSRTGRRGSAPAGWPEGALPEAGLPGKAAAGKERGRTDAA